MKLLSLLLLSCLNSSSSRIYELLPPKIQQYQSTPCISEENNKKNLEKIRRQQLEARQRLGDLDLRHQELDSLLERVKRAAIDPEYDVSIPIKYRCVVYSGASLIRTPLFPD